MCRMLQQGGRHSWSFLPLLCWQISTRLLMTLKTDFGEPVAHRSTGRTVTWIVVLSNLSLPRFLGGRGGAEVVAG